MPLARRVVLVTLALLAFAGNSLLCRAALLRTPIDPGTFTAVRLVSGALVLVLLVRLSRGPSSAPHGTRRDVPAALALFGYAVAFSYAYRSLSTATGALLLFGAVQVTLVGWGWWRGERLSARQSAGLVLACAGLVGLLLPGWAAPPVGGALLMLAAGAAWGVYTVRGKRAGEPLRATASNFALTVPLALAVGLLTAPATLPDPVGVALAVASGVLASGLGYAIWYAVLPSLAAPTAATLQLTVPLIATAGGALLLGEPLTLRLAVASSVVLGGIALVVLPRRTPA